MMPLVGRALVFAALVAALIGALVAFSAARSGHAGATVRARKLAHLFTALLAGAMVWMVAALLVPDFSVGYVAQVGSRSAPIWVRVVSLWSSLEGSVLFWGFLLGVFTSLYARAASRQPGRASTVAVGVLLVLGVFFAFLIALPANPFTTVAPAPTDGPGPNPLLQNHLLMVIHPPALYLGYVGMSVPFAIAVGALVAGSLDRALLRSLRAWLLAAWVFLTAGIVLGAWWAYEVLGWGGYWAWDPVENASLLPWLTATAAFHSLLVAERRRMLMGWSLTLVLATFLLTLLGTFMTRSGVFTSVHSFSPSDIGPILLGFLAIACVGSVLLLAARIARLEPEERLESAASREGAFLVNNLLFVSLTLTVLLGTVFPLVVEAVQGTRISVGEPYFNRMSVPLAIALLFLMGIGPALPWGRTTAREAALALLPPLLAAVMVAAAALALGWRNPGLVLAVSAGAYALQVALRELARPAARTGSAGTILRSRRRLGSSLAHAGVVLALVGVAASSALKQSLEVSVRRGQSIHLASYELRFLETQVRAEPHRESIVARFALSRGGEPVATLEPRMNYYLAMREPVGTPDVHSHWATDVYLSIVSIDASGERVAVRAFLNPMVVWIWIGGGLAMLGALVALAPTRRRPAVQSSPAPAVEPAPPEVGGT